MRLLCKHLTLSSQHIYLTISQIKRQIPRIPAEKLRNNIQGSKKKNDPEKTFFTVTT